MQNNSTSLSSAELLLRWYIGLTELRWLIRRMKLGDVDRLIASEWPLSYVARLEDEHASLILRAQRRYRQAVINELVIRHQKDLELGFDKFEVVLEVHGQLPR